VTIEGFRFEAADGSLPGESSVGAFVVNSTGVVLRRVEIVAGDGVKGADGGLVGFEYPDEAELNGNPESAPTMGGEQKICVCQGELASAGGAGGVAITGGSPGGLGLPNHGAGTGGVVADCGAGGNGLGGAGGPHRPPAAGAINYGVLNETGWEPEPGNAGEIGHPGQGGGGGASRNNLGHGGGGGCGGCGGNGGTQGHGGGASIALLSFDSRIALTLVNLIAGDGGEGGQGHPGQPGQQVFGGGGDAVSSNNSCDGGSGGPGGNGGASGGGAGGLSVGIVWAGEETPTQTEVMFKTGTFGEGGLGGEPGVNDGIDGLAQDVFEAT
jgi:hypothetical protein